MRTRRLGIEGFSARHTSCFPSSSGLGINSIVDRVWRHGSSAGDKFIRYSAGVAAASRGFAEDGPAISSSGVLRRLTAIPVVGLGETLNDLVALILSSPLNHCMTAGGREPDEEHWSLTGTPADKVNDASPSRLPGAGGSIVDIHTRCGRTAMKTQVWSASWLWFLE